MEQVVINPIQCVDQYKDHNRMMQSLMAAGGNHPHAIKPAHVHMVYVPIWIAKPWELSYMKMQDIRDAQLKMEGTSITGAPFPMRVVETDFMRARVIVAQTKGLLYFNWLFHRSKAKAKNFMINCRNEVLYLYSQWHQKVFTPYVWNIPETETNVFYVKATWVCKKKSQYFLGNDRLVWHNKKRILILGEKPLSLEYLAARMDGLHFLNSLKIRYQIARNPAMLQSLLNQDHPRIEGSKNREVSIWQKLLPKNPYPHTLDETFDCNDIEIKV